MSARQAPAVLRARLGEARRASAAHDRECLACGRAGSKRKRCEEGQDLVQALWAADAACDRARQAAAPAANMDPLF